MYTVETDGQAKHQVDALPAEALTAYAELRVVLETAPWSGRPYHGATHTVLCGRVRSAPTAWWCTSSWKASGGWTWHPLRAPSGGHRPPARRAIEPLWLPVAVVAVVTVVITAVVTAVVAMAVVAVVTIVAVVAVTATATVGVTTVASVTVTTVAADAHSEDFCDPHSGAPFINLQ